MDMIRKTRTSFAHKIRISWAFVLQTVNWAHSIVFFPRSFEQIDIAEKTSSDVRDLSMIYI